jgi:DNA (cytosine-5)-methyltransferase 1
MHRDLSEWVHPHYHRWITVREALRLQAFHDGFVLKSSEWQMFKQVGNAVPPLLGRVPAMAIRLAMTNVQGESIPFAIKGQLNLFGT